MLVYGKQTVLYLLDKHLDEVSKLYIAKELDKKQFSALHKFNIEIERVSPKYAQILAKSGNHQGYLCEVKKKVFLNIKELKNFSFVLILSEVTDVGNMGAMMRTAYALGVEAIVITGIKSVPLDGAARSSSGALFDIPLVHHENILDVMNELKMFGFELYGASMEGLNINTELKLCDKRVLIMGSEEKGLSNKVVKKLDQKISIPMEHSFNSLNVSVAAGILINRMQK
jgi:23S rRNA (guanosine2251-2'-O)-methyltransferase